MGNAETLALARRLRLFFTQATQILAKELLAIRLTTLLQNSPNQDV